MMKRTENIIKWASGSPHGHSGSPHGYLAAADLQTSRINCSNSPGGTCVLYSDDNNIPTSAEVANDLSQCRIRENEKPRVDRSQGVPISRLPLQVSQSIQVDVARPGKVVSSILRYNNCGAVASAEAIEQWRVVRNPVVPGQYNNANFLYSRRNLSCKNGRGEDEGIEGSNGLQPKPPRYIPRKVVATQGGTKGTHWY